MRVGATLAGGLLVKALMDPATYIYRVKSLAALDSPIGGEVEALIKESKLEPDLQKYLLEFVPIHPQIPCGFTYHCVEEFVFR